MTFKKWFGRSSNPVVHALHEIQQLFKPSLNVTSTFTTMDGKLITVSNGLITKIEDAI